VFSLTRAFCALRPRYSIEIITTDTRKLGSSDQAENELRAHAIHVDSRRFQGETPASWFRSRRSRRVIAPQKGPLIISLSSAFC
jgi:hypothetical protein